MQRLRAILVAISLVLSIGAQGAFAAEPDATESKRRAVKQVNGGASFGMSYFSGNGDIRTPPSSDSTKNLALRRASIVAWEFGGRATIPIGDSFGARIFLNGGRFSDDADLPFDGRISQDIAEPLNLSFGNIGVGSEVFWRDPNKGYVGLGYRYSRVNDQLQTHSPFISGGVFLKNVDLTLGFTYGRDSATSADLRQEPISSSPTFSPSLSTSPTIASSAFFVDGNSYAIDASLTWYLAEGFAIGADLGWREWGDADILESSIVDGSVRATFRPSLGFKRRRFLSLSFAIGGGGQDVRVPGFAELSHTFLQLSANVSFEFINAASLMELFREYR